MNGLGRNGREKREQQSPLGKSDEGGLQNHNPYGRFYGLSETLELCLFCPWEEIPLIWEKVAQTTRKCVFLTCRGTSSILQDLLCYCIEKGEQRKKESQHRFIFYYVFIPLDYFVTCSYCLSGHSKKGRS